MGFIYSPKMGDRFLYWKLRIEILPNEQEVPWILVELSRQLPFQ